MCSAVVRFEQRQILFELYRRTIYKYLYVVKHIH